MKTELTKLTNKLASGEITVTEYNKTLIEVIRNERISKYGIASGKMKGKRRAS